MLFHYNTYSMVLSYLNISVIRTPLSPNNLGITEVVLYYFYCHIEIGSLQ